jgi:quercetin dioxygenase-like cupin family protein
MKVHTAVNDEVRDQIILYSLNALDPAEAAEFEAHLKAGCDLCLSELQAFQKVTDQLSYSAPTAWPTPRVREQLIARIQEEPDNSSDQQVNRSGLLVLHSSQMDWEGADEAEIQTKDLFVDEARRSVTRVMRAPGGTHFPDHRHVQVEEVYVLEGDFHVGDQVLQPGDYCRAEPGTLHRRLFTEGGCTLLVRSSQHDEPLPEESSLIAN